MIKGAATEVPRNSGQPRSNSTFIYPNNRIKRRREMRGATRRRSLKSAGIRPWRAWPDRTNDHCYRICYHRIWTIPDAAGSGNRPRSLRAGQSDNFGLIWTAGILLRQKAGGPSRLPVAARAAGGVRAGAGRAICVPPSVLPGRRRLWP